MLPKNRLALPARSQLGQLTNADDQPATSQARQVWNQLSASHVGEQVPGGLLGASCRLVAFSRAVGFEEVSAMTFCKFYAIFCKVTFKVAPQSDPRFGPPNHPPDHDFFTILITIHTISSPSLHFWRRNVFNKTICVPKFAILEIRWHSRRRWPRPDETQILEVDWGSPCRLVAFFNAFCFEEVSAVTFLQMLINFLRNDLQSGPQSNPQFGPPDHPSDHPSDHSPKNKTAETSSKQKCTEKYNKSAWSPQPTSKMRVSSTRNYRFHKCHQTSKIVNLAPKAGFLHIHESLRQAYDYGMVLEAHGSVYILVYIY